MAALSSVTSFPIKTKQVCVDVNGICTDIVCRDFEDRIFIVVTQLQKLGTLVHISKDVLVAEDTQLTFTTKTLLGKDEPLIHVIARNIAVALNTSKPIVLGLALRDTSRETTKTIENIILENKVWG
ncbi:proteasome assembly chaperone 3-like [Liolophura sinensis]|uniref:proteasome assembly chaperone 3-like n=1 Tax=Liolophura sinensis TaxID=3198878 RepID=UPI0031584CD9